MLEFTGNETSTADSNVLSNMTQEVVELAPGISERRLQTFLTVSVQSSFQTDPGLQFPASERDGGTVGAAAAAGQPVLQQGPVRRRAAIAAATGGRIHR